MGKKYGFDGVEWIISDYSNPIFNKIFLKEIKKTLKKFKMKVCSIALDLIMKEPLHKIDKKNLDWLINNISYLQKQLIIPRITIPIEESSRYRNKVEKRKSLKNLRYVIKKLSSKSLISIETDISLKDLKCIFNNKSLSKLGSLVDIGNLRASNRSLKNYFDLFSDRIYGIHIKYREKNYGKSKNIPLKFEGLRYLGKHINDANNLKDITFQTYRSKHNYLYDMTKNIKGFNENFI